MDPTDPDLAHAPSVLQRFKRALNLSMAAVIALGAVFLLQGRIDNVDAFAIHPQDWASLPAILTAPLLHGSIEHLAATPFRCSCSALSPAPCSRARRFARCR